MMPYLSIDIETTGLDPVTCQILEIAVVAETPTWDVPVVMLPTLHVTFCPTRITGDIIALGMNADLIKSLPRNDTIPYDSFPDSWKQFLEKQKLNTEKINCAGKNFSSFDLQFLRFNWPKCFDRSIRVRNIDPAIYYWDPVNDTCLPSLGECCTRAGVNVVNHSALSEARAVIELIRNKYKDTEKCSK